MPFEQLFNFHDKGGQWTRRGSASSGGDPGATLLFEDFNTWTLGVGGSAWTSNYWNGRMGGGMGSGNAGQHPFHECKTNPDLGGRMMQVTCQAGEYGSAGGPSLAVPLSTACKRVRFRIRCKFVGPYEWGTGQKIPGPSATYLGENLDYPTGCKTITDQGGSFRLMQASHTGRPLGSGMLYMYGKDSSEGGWTCGEDGWMTDDGTPSTGAGDFFHFPENVFFDYVIDVTLNDPGFANGSATVTIDGQTTYARSNRETRTRTDVLFRGWLWHWFFGGNSANWAPTTDQRIWIDEVEITGWP